MTQKVNDRVSETAEKSKTSRGPPGPVGNSKKSILIARSGSNKDKRMHLVLSRSMNRGGASCSRCVRDVMLSRCGSEELRISSYGTVQRRFATALHNADKNTVLIVEEENGITTLTLNRPHKRNALNEELLSALETQLDRIASANRHSIRCLVIQANGADVFSSGHDLVELRGANSKAVERIFESCSRVMCKLAESSVPTISAVRGLATAAGLQLALSCDVVIAHENASFATPGVDIGLFCSTPSVALIRTGGNRRLITEMLFTGRRVAAQEALNGGLITRISESPEDEALQMARILASKSSTALSIGKRVLREHQACSTITDSYLVATKGMIHNMATNHAAEGISAFLEKRKPFWG